MDLEEALKDYQFHRDRGLTAYLDYSEGEHHLDGQPRLVVTVGYVQRSFIIKGNTARMVLQENIPDKGDE